LTAKYFEGKKLLKEKNSERCIKVKWKYLLIGDMNLKNLKIFEIRRLRGLQRVQTTHILK
jgi:hypothetical protein